MSDLDAIRITAQIRRMRGSFTPDAVAREVALDAGAVLEVLHRMWNKSEVLRTSPSFWRVIEKKGETKWLRI